MKKRKVFETTYQEILDNTELPLVYHFAEEYKSQTEMSIVRLIPSEFYQTEESFAYSSLKPISKIYDYGNE